MIMMILSDDDDSQPIPMGPFSAILSDNDDEDDEHDDPGLEEQPVVAALLPTEG